MAAALCEVEGLEPHTLRQYQSHVDRHIVPALGAIRLSKLTAPQVESFVDEMLGARSRAMTRKVLVSLTCIAQRRPAAGLVAQNVAWPSE